jgi:hypothetical protein
MRGLLGLWAALMLLAIPAVGRASDAVPGGRYIDRVHEHGVHLVVELTLANDGKEFAEVSDAEIRIRCSATTEAAGGLTLTSDDFGRFESVQVAPNGRFRSRPYFYGWLRGRFVKNGGLAVGRVYWSYPRFDGCPRVVTRFRARLVGRPNASTPGIASVCDPVTLAAAGRSYRIRARYEVLDLGVGCTAGRQIARAWDAAASCHALGPGLGCSVSGAFCESLRGGDLSALAVARCTPSAFPEARTELVRLDPCAIDAGPGETVLWTINLECALAKGYPLGKMLRKARAVLCAPDIRARNRRTQCASFAGFSCTFDSDYAHGDRGRCVREQDPFQGFDYELVPYDP